MPRARDREQRRRQIEAMPRAELMDRVMAWADEHEEIARELDVAAATRSKNGLDVAALRRSVDTATRTHGFVSTRESYDYARRLHGLASELATLAGAGHATAVVDLAERAVMRVDKALAGYIDDSSGSVGEAMRRLREVHLLACAAAEPDSSRLGAHLYRLQMDSEFAFEVVLPEYAEVLGPAGLATYRAEAEKDWEKVPAIGPGSSRSYWLKHVRLRLAMEALAKQSGDLEELVAVLRRDLSHPYSYLRIAEELAAAGDNDRALTWAEDGHNVFSRRGETDSRLVDFLVGEYQRRERHGDALELRWTAFEGSPSFVSFEALRASAEAGGSWPTTRERALAHLRAILRPAQGDSSWSQPGFTTLVDIYLSENDLESAWREAVAGGCQPQIWLKLARRLEAGHPERAIEIYRQHIDRVVVTTNNHAYAEAVALLKTIRRLFAAAGRPADFPPMVADIRGAYRQKRNLMRMLDAEGW